MSFLAHLNGSEAHLWFISSSQSHQVLHVLHKLVWVISLMHWSYLCMMQQRVDGEPQLMIHIKLTSLF